MCRCGRVVFMKFTVCFTSKFNTQFPLIEIIGKNTTNWPRGRHQYPFIYTWVERNNVEQVSCLSR